MKKYEEILDRMHFIIGSTLMDNNIGRQGIGNIEPVAETEILRTNRRTYMELKVMMMRLERALYGEKNYEEDDTEISNRDTSPSNNTESRRETVRSPRVGDFSC